LIRHLDVTGSQIRVPLRIGQVSVKRGNVDPEHCGHAHERERSTLESRRACARREPDAVTVGVLAAVEQCFDVVGCNTRTFVADLEPGMGPSQ
jgi:hypothetical protein